MLSDHTRFHKHFPFQLGHRFSLSNRTFFFLLLPSSFFVFFLPQCKPAFPLLFFVSFSLSQSTHRLAPDMFGTTQPS